VDAVESTYAACAESCYKSLRNLLSYGQDGPNETGEDNKANLPAMVRLTEEDQHQQDTNGAPSYPYRPRRHIYVEDRDINEG
jgi:hypothetical protein